MKSIPYLTWAAALCAFVLAAASGCRTINDMAADNLAAVTITNRPMADVQAAVTGVFTAHLFAGGPDGTNQFTFRRAGGGVDNLAYGSYMFEHPITLKVVVTTRQPATNEIVVGCKAWIIEAENDPVFQDSHPVSYFRRGPYEDLLKEVRSRLGQ